MSDHPIAKTANELQPDRVHHVAVQRLEQQRRLKRVENRRVLLLAENVQFVPGPAIPKALYQWTALEICSTSAGVCRAASAKKPAAEGEPFSLRPAPSSIPPNPTFNISYGRFSENGRPFGYSMAVFLVAGVTFLRLPLAPLLGNSVPFILYFPAIFLVAWRAGLGPGLVATLLSGYCAKTWFFEPYGTFSIPDWPSAFRLGLFLAIGGLISSLCARLRLRTAELHREKELLEEKVRERTAHLTRALQDMEAFSYTVSHDLRSPLRSMHGFSEILLEDYAPLLDETARNHLERIRNGAARLDHLIADLLTFAKVSGSTIEMHPILLADAVAGVLSATPRWSSSEVAVSAAGCGHTVLAHATLLDQVLQNLIENAVKFVVPGTKPEIRLFSEARGNVVRLWVTDNGIGIAAPDLQRLFKIFERVNGTNYTGTGIGLAIVDRAVAKMNGRVGVESTVGSGSRFWVELPAA